MSVDAQKVHDTVQDMHELWASPIMLTLTLAYLWTLLGPSCLAGLGFIMLLAPLNGGFLIRKFAGLQVYYHYNDVIMGAMASQITNLMIVYSTVYSAADQRKHQISVSLAFMRGIQRGPVNSPRKWPVTRKIFLFDDVIMWYRDGEIQYQLMIMLWHGHDFYITDPLWGESSACWHTGPCSI